MRGSWGAVAQSGGGLCVGWGAFGVLNKTSRAGGRDQLPTDPSTGVLCDLGQVTALSGLQFLLVIVGLNGSAIPRTTS